MLQKTKKYLIVGAILVFVIFLIFLTFSFIRSSDPSNFSITSATPKNGEADVYPGEIIISFTTDKPIQSPYDYSFYIYPTPDYETKVINEFPSTTIQHQILGGLERNTTYFVAITNTHTNKTTRWSFTTSNEEPESSSALFEEHQEELKENYYPLFDEQPYDSEDFSLYYTDRYELTVEIRKNDVERIKQDVLNWIRSKGVDPSTHTIIYENAF